MALAPELQVVPAEVLPQEYPSNVLAAKRLMAYFVPMTSTVKHKRKEGGPLDVAFVETKGT